MFLLFDNTNLFECETFPVESQLFLRVQLWRFDGGTKHDVGRRNPHHCDGPGDHMFVLHAFRIGRCLFRVCAQENLRGIPKLSFLRRELSTFPNCFKNSDLDVCVCACFMCVLQDVQNKNTAICSFFSLPFICKTSCCISLEFC